MQLNTIAIKKELYTHHMDESQNHNDEQNKLNTKD